MDNVFVLQHPLVDHHLCRLRDRTTPSNIFRATMRRMSVLLAYEATQDLELKAVEVETPLARTGGRRLNQRIGLVPILRAGLGMVDPVLDLIPEAEVWHLGFYRDEKTLQPVEYYHKLPPGGAVEVAMILDPMLATGGSALAAIQAVRTWGVERVKLLALIAAPEGIKAVQAAHPTCQIHVCAVDERLNERGYIVPGLGDAGDRVFNAQAC
jgi:uracil phosphoribosyltransferase